MDVHASFEVKENLENQTLSITAQFTGDDFPSTEAFVEDQQGNRLFLGASPEIGSIDQLFFDRQVPIFNVNMEVSFDDEGKFTGVKSFNKTYTVGEWNKRVEQSFENKKQ